MAENLLDRALGLSVVCQAVGHVDEGDVGFDSGIEVVASETVGFAQATAHRDAVNGMTQALLWDGYQELGAVVPAVFVYAPDGSPGICHNSIVLACLCQCGREQSVNCSKAAKFFFLI